MAKYSIIHSIKVATDFEPETFGNWATLGPKFRIAKRVYQVCQCCCGISAPVPVLVCNLRSGTSTSCGCNNRKISSQHHTTHGQSKSREYVTWQGMKDRCQNPNSQRYRNYGGRGIRVCDRWLDPVNGYVNFLADMGRRPSDAHSIERKDNDGNYSANNCEWAISKKQGRNRRSNRLLTAFGRTQCLIEWAEELGVPSQTIINRINRGDSVENSLARSIKRNPLNGS